MPEARFLTVGAVAKRIGRAVPTISAMVARGQLEGENLETGSGGPQLIITRDSVERYESSQLAVV